MAFGAASAAEAREILAAIESELAPLGLRLNPAKTWILESGDIPQRLHLDRRGHLQSLDAGAAPAPGPALEAARVLTAPPAKPGPPGLFAERLMHEELRAAGRLRSPALLDECVPLFIHVPAVRRSVAGYLGALGYNDATFETLLALLRAMPRDDIAPNTLAGILLDWSLPCDDVARRRTEIAAGLLERPSSGFVLQGALQVRAAYGEAPALRRLIDEHEQLWRGDPFLNRQVTAVLPRLWAEMPAWVEARLREQVRGGESRSATVAGLWLRLSRSPRLRPRAGRRLFFPHGSHSAFLPALMGLLALARSEKVRGLAEFREGIEQHVTDPWYRRWVDEALDP